MTEMPTVVFSSAIGPLPGGGFHNGDARNNGGVKIYNGLVKLLRQHGYDAYICTWNGTYEEWLIEHQPVISLATLERWQAEGRPLKVATGWIDSTALLQTWRGPFYFLDAEIAFTAGEQHAKLCEHWKRIRRVAVNSTVQQVWYMAEFGVTPVLLKDASDRDYWFPDNLMRHPGRVGYMDEGPETAAQIAALQAATQRAGLDLTFSRIGGDEAMVIGQMHWCDVFLGMNPGKHPLWGEGCPRSPQEAMHAGCVVIAFDVMGNHEYVIDGATGYLVPRGRLDLMALRLIQVMRDRDLLERLRATSMAVAEGGFALAGRMDAVRDWLEL